MPRTEYKVVLPTPTDYIRFMQDAILNNVKNETDTSLEVLPIVTRAKLLVDRDSVTITTVEVDH